MTFEKALQVANGNRSAATWLYDYLVFCKLLDTIIDEPGKVTDERLAEETLNLLANLCNPGWARDNAPRLFPLMVTGANAWLDGNRMAKSEDYRTQLSSDVVKSSCDDMVYWVAYLTANHGHMRHISAGREYDYDVPLKEDK